MDTSGSPAYKIVDKRWANNPPKNKRCVVAYRYNLENNRVEKGKCKLPKHHGGDCQYVPVKP